VQAKGLVADEPIHRFDPGDGTDDGAGESAGID
jgi:hypothetical protein